MRLCRTNLGREPREHVSQELLYIKVGATRAAELFVGLLLPVFEMKINLEVKFVVPMLSAVLLSVSSVIAQQTQRATPDFRGLPDQARLVQRIQEFVEAQRDQDWNRVSDLLGPFRGSAYSKRFTNEHKQCLIEQMKTDPMLTFAPIGAGYSTEILGRPLSQKWWYISGIAEFAREGRNVKSKSTIIAYRFEGRWFFTPPNYDDSWEATKITEPDLSEDLSRYLKVEIRPDCPLKLVRLSVRIDPKYRSLRRVSFDLRNNSRKEVDGLSFRIVKVNGDGSVSSGMPFKMMPGETVSSSDNIKYSGYLYFCEGESYNRFIIDSVGFKDGTEWKLRKARVKRR